MRILIIGTIHPDLATASRLAAARGNEVAHLADLPAALDHLRAGRGADIVLVDVQADIRALIRALTQEHFWLPVIAYGIDADASAAVRAIRSGAIEFLPLPPDPELIAAVLDAIGRSRADFIAEDPATLRILEVARQFAPTEASILITGESGTGKEVIARFLHRQSRRHQTQMVAVNCAAIPENLLESELFGHEKGAFTGALARRVGKFEEADRGTLLLDEISEMDLRLQAKLLRAIQEKEIDRLGGTRPVKVDIRLLATSNRDLEAEVRAGRFREDLFFRLNVLNLELPPLRRRSRDIEALARYFLDKHAAANHSPATELGADALLKLESHTWPGNVRELENCLHRAVILATGNIVGAEAILLQTSGGRHEAGGAENASLIGRSMAEVERDLILGTLDHALGNRTHAAKILGISIRTLRNKLKDYAAANGDCFEAEPGLSPSTGRTPGPRHNPYTTPVGV